MSDERKVPARQSSGYPVLRDVATGNHLQSGEDFWFGSRAGILERRKRVSDNATALMQSQARQADAYTGLIDARMRVARKFGELADLPNLLAEEQREREHARGLSETRRASEIMRTAHDLRLMLAQQDLEYARTQEQIVRARRNLEAAERVKDAEIDAWYQQATSRRNEAEATRQDTDADLRRTAASPAPDSLKAAAADELARAIATIDNEIELARQRGNAAGVLALQNIKARLNSAA